MMKEELVCGVFLITLSAPSKAFSEQKVFCIGFGVNNSFFFSEQLIFMYLLSYPMFCFT